MPYVLRLASHPKYGDTFFAGPVKMVTPAQNVASGRSHHEALITSRDIDTATRVPLIFGVLAQLKQDTLKAQGVRTELIYDTPQPLKLLARLLPF